ncbi:YnbE family lipoprotein [Azospirillum soli]|uniref:YnbE family lipoprotein n=1 Tax=Azospirillum soli TaxID=1304799 RepID=UPI001AE5D9AE|nr:YnbE family lipoprotein [Azospirillum soli]MBP2314452.1 type IV pilus biogenesis protein CpaD/CtpE [Azospirillum soli]
MTIPFISRRVAIIGLAAAGLAACAPTVKIEAPDKPIEINLNIRIEQEVRVKVERDLDKAIAEDPALFGLPPASTTGGTK